MTDVSVEETTEETGSPAETISTARPFSLGLSSPSALSIPSLPEPVVEPIEEPIGEPAEEPVSTTVTGPINGTVNGSISGTVNGSAAEPVAAAVVKGRIKVADEVVEKVAALATLEVTGVVGLGSVPGDAVPSTRERVGARRREPQGVSAHVQDRTVAVDVAIVAEYGHVVMDVANEVKTNVARTVSRMLGMRVVEVNVNVDDVRLPGEDHPETPAES
ncbi:Asp23/Gls24 family envelope stress response protein [Streptosporangium sp. CA-135522]|uniref:Asp23/Gls24 family envelope stress response protein n=1 Tax=Streptosporangium sp. CA-135522 TaxID=3240072 RepID=UPI003D8B3F98